jgi:hypothetical protein
MGDDATVTSDEGPLAPLVALVNRLRADVAELQGRWEELGEELEAKRRRLGLAEVTMERIKQRQEEAPQAEEGQEGLEGVRAQDEENVSQAAQASGDV